MTERTEAVVYNDLAKMGCHPFTYDRSTKKFVVGDESFWLVADVMNRMQAAIKDLPDLTPDEVKNYPLVHSHVTGDTYGLPKLSDFYTNKLGDEQRYEIQQDVEATMREAIAMLDPTTESLSPLLFKARLVEDRPITMKAGEASLNVSAKGQVGETIWPHGFYEYTASNANDLPEWKVALFSGLGRLAAIATELD